MRRSHTATSEEFALVIDMLGPFPLFLQGFPHLVKLADDFAMGEGITRFGLVDRQSQHPRHGE